MLIFRGLPGASDPYVKVVSYDDKTSMLLKTASIWSTLNKKSVLVNAIDNGQHGESGTVFTFHGLSLAWDLGVITGLKSDLDMLGDYLKVRLPPPYQVLVESDHVHIEWDTGLGR
jgi:hypothetical protein